jgi:hydroxymethylglutaryl-CoA lyase
MSKQHNHPKITIVEEGMREGMQIESAAIPVGDKIRLLDALSGTGLKNIVVGSFVSPKWVPQMAAVEEVVEGFTPAEGVNYTALALNARGAERREAFRPKISAPDTKIGQTRVHLCDVFVQRNTAKTMAEEIAAIPGVIDRAVANGATEAMIAVNAAWGSNWIGEITETRRMEILQLQHDAWTAAGIPVTRVQFGDPMSWNTPGAVRAQIRRVLETWPGIRTVQLHLHNARGMAPISAYMALSELDSRHELIVDTAIGGLGGCPYCGNGRATRMIPTEDFVHMLEGEGIETGVDLGKLIEAAILAEEVVGHELWGHVSKAGPRPYGHDVYAMDMPFIETFEQAQHFRLGSSTYAGALAPWKHTVISTTRDEFEQSLLATTGGNA